MKAFHLRVFLFGLATFLISQWALPAVVPAREFEYFNPQKLVGTSWLKDNLNRSQLRVIDFGRNIEDYKAGHIPHAFFLDRGMITTKIGEVPGMLAYVEKVVDVLEKAAISNDSTVVIYDGFGGLWASRLFWALEYLGHEDVRLLNGGWNKWMNEGGKVSKKVAVAKKGSFVPQVHPERLATKDWVLENLKNTQVKILDVRSPLEYRGENVRSDRGGHIPDAVNINWIKNLTDDDDKVFLPSNELRTLYEEAGIMADKEIVTHCQTGIRAAHSYFTLRLLGYTKVRLYDGSWAEWGNDPETPIVSEKPSR
jgi:thiosulfate/3-mercaptopyruvate sulfurtransferase